MNNNFIFSPAGQLRIYIKDGNNLYLHLSFLVGCGYLGIKNEDVRFYQGEYALCGNNIRILPALYLTKNKTSIFLDVEDRVPCLIKIHNSIAFSYQI